MTSVITNDSECYLVNVIEHPVRVSSQVARAHPHDSFFGAKRGNYKSVLLSLDKTHVARPYPHVVGPFVNSQAAPPLPEEGNDRSRTAPPSNNVHSWPGLDNARVKFGDFLKNESLISSHYILSDQESDTTCKNHTQDCRQGFHLIAKELLHDTACSALKIK